MAAKRSGLGKGLGALIQRTDEASQAEEDDVVALPEGVRFAEVPIDAISPNSQQPRTVFDDEPLEELAQSLKDVGLLQPITVREQAGGSYELIMGERRWRAAQLAGMTTIPVIVRNTADDELLREALLENLHRVQLNALEEAAAYRQMLDDFGCTQEELASKVQRSRPHIANTLRLLRLPSTVQRRIAAGVLTPGHARALLALEDPLEAERLAQRIVAEGLSVRAVEEIIALRTKPEKARAPRAPREPSEREVAAASSLSEVLDTRVNVHMGKNKGQIVIEFAEEDDLNRILGLIQK